MTEIEEQTACSAWGEGWSDSMPPTIAEQAAEDGTISDSCLEK